MAAGELEPAPILPPLVLFTLGLSLLVLALWFWWKSGGWAEWLTFLRWLKLHLTGRVYIGHWRMDNWSGVLPFYAFRCPNHGLMEDYPHGFPHNQRLDCPHGDFSKRL